MFAAPSPRFVRVDVGHISDRSEPLWSFEMLKDAPLRSLGLALTIAAGDDEEWRELEDERRRIGDLGAVWGGMRATAHTPIGASRQHWVAVSDGREALVGEPLVALRQAAPPARAPRVAWWRDATMVDPLHLQHELDDVFGFVPRTPEPWDYGAPASPLVSLLSRLPAFERLSLLTRIDQRGLLKADPLRSEELMALTTGLATFVGAIGDGIEQEDAPGALAEIGERVASELGWPPDAPGRHGRPPGEDLVRASWDLRLLRRLRGRIVPTRKGRLADARAMTDVALEVLTHRHHRRHSWAASFSPASTLALLAIADGVGDHLARLPAHLATQLETARTIPPDGMSDVYPIHSANPAEIALPDVLDALALLSAPGAFGRITLEMRRLAHVAITRTRFPGWF
jgi:hypothetical protein